MARTKDPDEAMKNGSLQFSEGSSSREQLEQEGYVILRHVIGAEVVEAARAEVDKLVDRAAEELMKAGKVKHSFRDTSFETRIFRLYEHCLGLAPKSFRPELHLPGFYAYFFHPQLLDLVEEMLGGEVRLYPNYTLRPKLPNWEGTRIWWHQDGGYTKYVNGQGDLENGAVDDLRMINVWSPLVPAREENGCMQFVPGTHKLGVVPHVSRRYYLEIIDPTYTPLFEKAVSIELDPGDVVLFSNLLFHQGLPNRSSTVRWNLDWRYHDARQPTLRKEQGHIARSRSNPTRAVRSAEEWAQSQFS